jgi:hypothetical protein
MRFHIANTYGRKIHIGVTKRRDNVANGTYTDSANGWGCYVYNWEGKHNGNSKDIGITYNCGNESDVAVKMDRTEGKLWVRAKPHDEAWKPWQEVYEDDSLKTDSLWFAVTINDKEDRIQIDNFGDADN